LTVALPPHPLFVEGDKTRLAQVLSNLLANAAKYTLEGGRIWLSVSRGPERAVIRVRDTGVGIPPEMLPHVFEMFTQVDRSLGRAQGGLGIGLTLVRSFVQMHGGTIEAFSDGPGLGSEFVVHLPLAAEVPPFDGNGQTSTWPEKAAVPAKRRILVVDDNKDAAEMLGQLLETLGNEVRIAHDGPSALEAAAAFRPHVVLLDIGLPGISGYDVARKMRQMPEVKDALLVAQTGWGQDEDKRHSEQAGFNTHLVKPVPAADLCRLLDGLPPRHD
jgi:CheY-like chemotaxis protein